MRAYTHRLFAFAIQCAMMIALTFSLSFSAGQSFAQDVTPETPAPSETATLEPTVVPTEVPTEVPTLVPTEPPTGVPTEPATLEPTVAPTDSGITPEPTGEPVTLPPPESLTPPPTPANSDVFTEDFEDGDSAGWLLTPGWTLVDEAGNQILAASTPAETAMLTGISWPYYTLSFRVLGQVQLSMTAGGSTYQITIAADGAASLFKDTVLLTQAAGVPLTDTTAAPVPVWHTVNILAPGNVLAVKVDDLTPISTSDPLLTGMGPLVFSTDAAAASLTALDDVTIKRLDAPPPAPTAEPTLAIGTLPPPSDVTAEPTVEATVEVTVEATTEATVEATVEATAESTPELVGLSETARQKLPVALVDLLNTYLAGDVVAAQSAAADYFIHTDDQARLSITIWAIDEASAASIAGSIPLNGGVLTSAFSVQLQALVTLEGLLALVNAPEVSFIEVPPPAVSTSTLSRGMEVQGTGQGTGTEVSEGLDTIGATAWHAANVKGAGVGIAVIDTGFGYSSANTAAVGAAGEYACLFNNLIQNQAATPTDTLHGLNVVQVLCDVAPAAKVYMYKAVNAGTLQDAITLANANASIKVILIAMDLGASVSPGDGTGGGIANGLYSAISSARTAGKVVVASAGNNTGRYTTLNYTSGTVTIPMTLFAGDTVHVSWNDWAATTGGKNFGLSLSGTFSTTFSAGGGARPNNAPPRSTYTVSATDCPAATNPSGCSENLTINNPFGAAPVIIQVQVAGNGSLNEGGIVASGATVVTTAGNIARPADSQDVIAVGSVCPDAGTSLFLDPFSSHGPVFAAGGAAPTVVSPYTRDQVKPDLVAPTHVSISGSAAAQLSCDETTGFNGTSAAAAHVAGMAALLVSNTDIINPSMTAFDGSTSGAVDALQDYLQTHTIDHTTLPGFAVGYDNFYGAGYTMLGSPTYNLAQIAAVNVAANQLPSTCSAAKYVGLNNPGSSQDGTLLNPFISINDAVSKATASECVVVLPGEYVGQIYAGSAALTPAVLSYEAATSFATNPTNLWSVIQSPIFIDNNDLLVDGFVAQRAALMTSIVAGSNFGLSIRSETPALRIRASTNAVVQNSTFLLYRAPGTLTDNTNVQIKNNLFSGFIIPTTGTGSFTSPQKNSAILEITNSTGILVTGNTFQNSTIPATFNTPSPWQPAIIGVRYSGVKFYNNQYKNNTASAIIGVNQLVGGPGSTLRTDEVQVVGNLFTANTLNGPLLHLFALPNMRFVNNSVVNNVMQAESSITPSATSYDGYFVYGVTTSAFGDIGSRKVEIHNNLFTGNGTIGRGLLSDVASGLNIGCAPIQPSTVPVRNNWFNPVIGANPATTTLAGECTGQIANSIDEPINLVTTFFGASYDPVHPFRLRPTDSSLIPPYPKSGINTGDNQALIDIFGTDPNTGYTMQSDMRGTNRVMLGGNPNPTYQTTTVDIGAYELGTANAPTANPISLTINEDSSPSVVFNLTAAGGYTQTFALTTLPTEYDPSPTNACLGQPVRFTAPNIVTYCPPANFHTKYGAGDTHVPVVIGFSVEDRIFKPGELSTSTISLTIEPIEDGSPTPPNFNALSDYFTPINQQLSPIVQFGNFTLNGTGGSVDYPFTFAFGAKVASDNDDLLKNGSTSTIQALTAAFTAANSNGGKLILNPVAGQQGFYKFTYTVTDQDGDTGTGNATIVIVPTLAQEGTYDDASFNFVYNGAGWAPSFVSGAYNNSLHATTIAGDSLELPFTGAVVRFNLRGSAAGNATSNTLKLAFKIDLASGVGSYQDYATANLPPDVNFTCVNSINGAAPNGSSDVTNYSATGAAYTITCSGFPTGQVHSIRLTNNLNGAALTLDRADISAGVMTAGKSYQENSANITYTGAWTQGANAAMLGGAWTFTNQNNASFSFNIDSSVGRLIFYRTTYLAGVYGTMNVFLDGNLVTPVAVIPSNTSTTFQYAQPFLLTIASPGDHTITVRNVGTTFSNLDQITALPIAQAMSVGNYQETYADLTYTGAWVQNANAGMLGGGWTYTNETGASVSFKIDSTVSRIIVYRTIFLAGVYGTMNVYLDNGTTPIATIANNTSTTFLSSQPFLINIPSPGTHTIRLQNVSATYSSIDQISLLGDTQTLTATPGVYQENDLNLTYTGRWTQGVNANMLGGAWAYTNEAGASVSFKINSTVSRVVIYRTIYQAGVYGTMNVLVNGVQTAVISSNTASTFQYGQPFILDVTPGDNVIKIQNVGTTYGNIEQIRLIGSLSRLGVGTYQDSNLNLTYTGNWTPDVNANMLGGTRRFTNQANAQLSFKIDGSVERMVFYRTTSTGWGTMEVAIDGTPVTPVMINSSGTTLFGQPFMVTIPLPGQHDITVKNLSAAFGDIDQIVLLGASQYLSVNAGTLQESSLELTYKGNWVSSVSGLNLGGARQFTNENNAEVSFKINSSVGRVVIFRTIFQAGVYGTMNVLVDGSQVTTINNNTSSTFLSGQPFVLTIGSPGDHIITLRNVGTTYSDLDQIMLLPAATRLTAAANGSTYQDNHQDITYTAGWTYGTHASMSGNSWHFTNQNNASFSFDVDASVGRIIFYRTIFQPGVYGTMQVFVDGSATPTATIPNNTSSTFLYNQPFVVTLASPGNHTITVKNVGTTFSSIDQIDLLPPSNVLTATPGDYQETDINLTYRGVWTQAANPQTLAGGWRFTNDPNASVSFDIDASVSRVIIYRTIYAPVAYGTMQVFLDNSTTPLVSIPNNTSTVFLYGQPFAFDIALPGPHTITIKNVGTAYSGIDQITLLGAAQRLGLGDYQEDDDNLIFSNNWTQAINGSAFANGWRYTNDATASVKFDINSSVGRIVIYRTTFVPVAYGSMQVFLGTNLTTPIATISNASDTLLFKQPVVVPITNPGDHTITIKNVGTTYSTLDQISLLGPSVSLGVGDYQETDFNLSYSGNWTLGANVSAFGSGWAYTNTANGSVSFKVDSATVKRMVLYRTTNIAGAYGTMNVYFNGGTSPVATINNVSGAVFHKQPFFLTIPPSTTSVELRNIGTTYSTIDQISLLGDPAPISAVGSYEENNPVFTYTGAWTSASGTEPSGSAAFYTYAPNASVSFKVTGTAFSIIRTLAVGSGTFTVSIDGGTPVPFSNVSTGVFWQQPIEFSGLSDTTHDVVITKTSPATDFIYFDAVRIVNPAAALTVGQYQETYPGLTYTGTWTPSGEARVSTVVGNQMTFTFTGTGFGVITATPTTGAKMDICYTIQGGSEVCNANLVPAAANLGYSYYNLKYGTYSVRVTHTGTAGQGLFIDRVFVLDTPANILQPGTYEENAAGIVYSPRDLWPSITSSAYSGGTFRQTNQTGAVVQLRFNGNALFLYQAAHPVGSARLNLCVYLTDAAGNATSVCTTYSQNSPTTLLVAPVAFYGFGSGVHEVVVENRSQLPFNLDRILVN